MGEGMEQVALLVQLEAGTARPGVDPLHQLACGPTRMDTFRDPSAKFAQSLLTLHHGRILPERGRDAHVRGNAVEIGRNVQHDHVAQLQSCSSRQALQAGLVEPCAFPEPNEWFVEEAPRAK